MVNLTKFWWSGPTIFANSGLMRLSTIFQLFSWRKPEYPEKTTDLSQVTDKFYHIMLYTSPWSRFKLTTSVMIGTDCMGSCKANYHTITATTAPIKLKNYIVIYIYPAIVWLWVLIKALNNLQCYLAMDLMKFQVPYSGRVITRRGNRISAKG